MTKQKFINESKPKQKDPSDFGAYSFDQVPRLLLAWSRFFQCVISQAGTFMVEGKFHDGECGIYKSEGGCVIRGYGELVLYSDRCREDYGRDRNKKEQKIIAKLADLISVVVLRFDPMNPLNSIMEAASITVGCNRDDLEAALAKTGGGNPFSGNALSSFFDYNPFSSKEVDRDYERYCYEEVNKVPKAEVDQIFADRDLGKKLFKKLKDKCKKDNNDKVSYYLCPMCCSPSRHKGKLRFWINTGRDTQLDGWKSPEDIEAFLNSNEVLKDTASCQ